MSRVVKSLCLSPFKDTEVLSLLWNPVFSAWPSGKGSEPFLVGPVLQAVSPLSQAFQFSMLLQCHLARSVSLTSE